MRKPDTFAAIIFAIVAAVTPVYGFAAESATNTSPSLGGSVLQMILSLAGVLALLLGSLWVLKRLTMQRGGASGLMRVIAATAVGGRERVVIVEVGDTWLVLGVAPGQITALAEIPRQQMHPAPTSSTATQPDFPAWLRHLLQKR
jgi:flagellar protein FliO/FliZ